MISLNAIDFISSNGSVVETSEVLASCIINHLEKNETVEISMLGMTGVGTSFFSLLIRRIVERFTIETFIKKVSFIFTSPFQKQTFGLSLLAVQNLLTNKI